MKQILARLSIAPLLRWSLGRRPPSPLGTPASSVGVGDPYHDHDHDQKARATIRTRRTTSSNIVI